jgi:hypothetical protein
MMRQVLVRPEAESDIAEAYRWYEGQRPGLGSDFVLCVEDGLARIQRDPEMYSIVHRNIPRLLIRLLISDFSPQTGIFEYFGKDPYSQRLIAVNGYNEYYRVSNLPVFVVTPARS